MANLPVPVLRTFTVGETETGAYLNSLRDALNFLINPPLAVLTQTSAQGAWSAFAAITFDTTVSDTYGGHSNSTNNTRYTAQVAGFYDVSGVIAFTSSSTGVRDAAIFKNGANPNYTTTSTNAVTGGTGTYIATLGVPLFLNVGDYVELYGNSGNIVGTISSGSAMAVRWRHA